MSEEFGRSTDAVPSAKNEKTATQKYACPACGGEQMWHAGKLKLICAFCGTESDKPLPSTAEPGAVVEHDLMQALMHEDNSSWQAAKRSIKCQSCQAVSVFEQQRQSQSCDFCGSTALVPYEEKNDSIRPESVLPFQVSESKARELIHSWYGKIWFAPNALKKRALTDTVKGVYLPYWTFDAYVNAQWTAEAGHYYTETVYQNGEAKQVQRVRWEYAAGNWSGFYDDELVCGSRGIHASLLKAIEPFPTQKLAKVYDPAFLSGWTVERYQINLPEAAKLGRDQMQNKTESQCAAQVPGDTYRNLQVQARFSRQTYKHTLAPVWLLNYHYGVKSYQVLINGHSGKIDGEHPISWVKVFFLTLAIVLVLGMLMNLSNKNDKGSKHRRADAQPAHLIV
ncbi:MAG: hypothetical protein RLZZ502_800 [Pseudomonadota bacterium]